MLAYFLLPHESMRFTLPDNSTKTRQPMLPDLYVRHVVTDVEHELSDTNEALKTCVSTPIHLVIDQRLMQCQN